MKSYGSRPFLREVEKEFSRIYPYLKIEFPGTSKEFPYPGTSAREQEVLREKAHDVLLTNTGLADGMTIRELESTIQTLFATPVQIFRKCGKMWLETKMTRDWTLKQQNDQGRELAPGE